MSEAKRLKKLARIFPKRNPGGYAISFIWNYIREERLSLAELIRRRLLKDKKYLHPFGQELDGSMRKKFMSSSIEICKLKTEFVAI
jgi:hypothetical protein